ncbi:hypothetical protein [Natrialba asiatica]|uniref:Uncharacterized protein n=1 Tax=Natrialba asiatica (strain ATCC 700177 / DSM 12278 / JCM 9576 / FERM P-10747 / NBRC 102637 / 172P1) TaxID=29540 RepID=M0AU00_NATA1|nr:hypothetical protein [Natrialba asiatica]ELZ02005.1 hypothetical protein C481_09078 [Natrialba asiatica DSM 12278]
MSVHIECDACGCAHTIPDRAFDPEFSQTVCPNCGGESYTVRRTELGWHPP